MASFTRTLWLQNIEQVSASGIERSSISVDLRGLRNDKSIDCDGFRMYPALWNAHDHLEFNLFPRIGTGPYNNAYEWGLEITQQKRDPAIDKVLSVTERTRYYLGALKNILSATPFVLHHGETPEFLSEGAFPITILPGHSSPHSLRFEKTLKKKFREGTIRSIHLAEGMDPEAHSELQTLFDMGFLNERTGIVHGVGLSEADIQLISTQAAKFIWCPSSNDFLFSRQAPVQGLAAQGIPILLGSDSTLTGTDGMLSEIRFAHTVANDPAMLFRSTTQTLRQWVSPFMSSIADSFFIVPRKTDDAIADFVSIQRSDIALLVHDNSVLLCDPDGFELMEERKTMVAVDGRIKHVAGEWKPLLQEVVDKLGPGGLHGVTPL
jgi:amidohydrolase family protein